jgi:DNA-binding transcriptional LysR family regulator
MPEADSLLRVAEDVTFAQLRTFACAAGSGSFAKAAEQLDISQPAVSEQIKTLEIRLGRALFERRRGTTPVLTADGEEALEMVHAILTANSNLFRCSRKSVEKIVLRISAGPFLREKYLRSLVPRIYREHPEVEIEFHPTGSSAEVMHQIERGELDLAIYAIQAGADRPPHTRQICELPLAMVAPAGTRARLSAGECSLEDFQYMFPVSRELGARWARKVLRDLRLVPRIQPRFVEFVDALVQMVEDGQGIGHLMIYSVADKIAEGLVEPLDIPLAPMRRLICHSPHAPAVAKVIEEMLCEELLS